MTSPCISIPKKKTDEVDWTSPIRSLIQQSYGESPDNYATECAALQRCRQDAVRGAGSDSTARDLLYKYFGQLELLELRFAEIRVSFPWYDAFTGKLTTQTSLAFEKASIIFQIAATHTSIAASQNRADPEGLKRAIHYFRTAAGMLTYINDNFLHAPSTDLSKEVVKFLVGIAIAQATEVVYEKLVEEKKALVTKVASQTAYLYNALQEDVKEFMGRGIFDRNWVTLIQIKAKYFASLTQYHRALTDDSSGKHGDALVRFQIAETHAKEAHRLAQSFTPYFVVTLTPTMPSDAGVAILELTKSHLALCTEHKNTAQKDNDLIYHSILPSEASLPVIDKVSVATPIPIQEVYGTPEVQKVIGPDLFIRLVPLSVHESASVYSEEKAKLVRGESTRAEEADGDLRAGLDSLGLPGALAKFREMAEGSDADAESAVPQQIWTWKEEVENKESENPTESILAQLEKLKAEVDADLATVSRELELESRECESMRVKYEHLWTQEPSASRTAALRQELKSHREAFAAAASSDGQVLSLWQSTKPGLDILRNNPASLFQRVDSEPGSLLDLDEGANVDTDESNAIKAQIEDIDEILGRLNKIKRERGEVLKDLKEKVQNDDVSHLLLLNRRSGPAVETALFASELEKFRPYQSRLASTVHHQQAALQEVGNLLKRLQNERGRSAWAKKWEAGEKKRKDAITRIARAREGWVEVREGAGKGIQFYQDLASMVSALKRNAISYTSSRKAERDRLASEIEVQRRLSAPAVPPPVPPPPSTQPRSPTLEGAMGGLNLGSGTNSGWSQPPRPPSQSFPPPPPQRPAYASPAPPHPRLHSNINPSMHPGYSSPAPPPDPYAGLGSAFSTTAPTTASPSPYPPPPSPSRQSTYPPPPPPARQGTYPPPVGQAQSPYPPLHLKVNNTAGMHNMPPQQYGQQPPQQYGQQYGQQQPQYGQQQPQYGQQPQYQGGIPPPPPPVNYSSPPPGGYNNTYGGQGYGR
ncbi:vacuolar protein sorting-associated protein BRO1 [Rhizoctonia solani]|uniref:BRO domain-containing protein 1 n=1 Tax=Rhizoctonia solani TaxID=456999 RepID=A0A8H8P5H2_9AGAM|nr:vacuolar protein sorting-associated protein BRO1 [Rhizoctonia solani]QRW25996.1 vacuolar protein sorting-associated protein BRO1 [Rhizoctonia solani]